MRLDKGRWTAAVMATALLGQSGCAADATTARLATQLSLTTAASFPARNRVPFPVQPTVQIQDANGSALAQSGTMVAASLSGSGTLGGRTNVETDANGRASFTDLVIMGTVGDKTLMFSATGLAPASSSVTLTAGLATTMALSVGASQSAMAGTTVATAPAVRITDADANAVAGIPATFSVTAGGGSVAGGGATSDVAGTARVTSWTLGMTAGLNTLVVTSPGLAGNPIAFTANGVPGAPAALAKVAGDAQAAIIGTSLPIAPSTRLTDANGNAIAGATVTFAVALGGGSVTGAAQATDASGVARVGSWTLGTAAGPNTLTAAASGVATLTFNATAAFPPVSRFDGTYKGGWNSVDQGLRDSGTVSFTVANGVIAGAVSAGVISVGTVSAAGELAGSGLFNGHLHCEGGALTVTFAGQLTVTTSGRAVASGTFTDPSAVPPNCVGSSGPWAAERTP